jgi:hypothetical protein
MPYLAAVVPYAVGAVETAPTVGAYFGAAAEFAGIAGTALSYNASMEQAKQSRMNADAQAQALTMESQRQSQETQQAQLRTAQNQRRFMAGQEASQTGNGFISTTGSPLSIMFDTYNSSQRDLQDIGYQGSTTRWGLQNSAQAAQSQGYSQASATMGQAGGTLLSNAGNIANQAYRAYKG